MKTRITQNKLNLLKQSILEENDNEYFNKIDAQIIDGIKNDIRDASSVSEVWYLIFKKQLFKLYSIFIESGIDATTTELNEICEKYNAAPWYGLALSCEGMITFKELLEQGKQLDSKVLIVSHHQDKKNIWQALFNNANTNLNPLLFICDNILKNMKSSLTPAYLNEFVFSLFEMDEISIEIKTILLQTLIKKNIYPDSRYLKNIWEHLAESKNVWMLDLIIEKNVLPTPDQISRNFFTKLTKNDLDSQFIRILNALIKGQILHDSMQLSSEFWQEIVENRYIIFVIDILVKNNILPCKDQLENELNGQFWRGLLSMSGLVVGNYNVFLFEVLLKKILDLKLIEYSVLEKKFNECDENGNSVWSGLIHQCSKLLSSNSNSDLDLDKDKILFVTLKNLFQNNCLPDLSCLNHSKLSPSLWRYLLKEQFTDILKFLLENGRLPNQKNMEEVNFISELKKRTKDNEIPQAIRIIELHEKYNLNFDCPLTRYLTDNNSDLYSFLYFYYSNLTVLDNDTLLYIGKYLLSKEIAKHNITLDVLISDKSNRDAFIKYHTIFSLEQYNKSLFSQHKERAKSLQQAIKENNSPEKTSAMLHNQYSMWISPETKPDFYLDDSDKKYQKPFSKNFITDKDFGNILQESCLLGNKKKLS